ncbi:prophage regulatory protein [Sphingomonas sp. SORGH_AS 950]|uniref:helix-turn-helix transcriptional regulator n=1 Tax=Sphingomonas sp. SORGH_AS_0950 TaxID=3041792 RepID=UPI002782AB6A|nr:AlpA family transcriptional regulator [Sphingomonas sp. SORGH_AS_0950]MDQ1158954.1 prophage regulatory protein [Sphingomonas sp. SORGH_AS_0950]
MIEQDHLEGASVPTSLVTDRLLRLHEVKQRVGLSKTTIYALIAEKRFPKPRKIKPAMARWSERDIDAWISSTAVD